MFDSLTISIVSLFLSLTHTHSHTHIVLHTSCSLLLGSSLFVATCWLCMKSASGSRPSNFITKAYSQNQSVSKHATLKCREWGHQGRCRINNPICKISWISIYILALPQDAFPCSNSLLPLIGGKTHQQITHLLQEVVLEEASFSSVHLCWWTWM